MTGIVRLPSGRYRVRLQQAKTRIKVPVCNTLEEAIALRQAIIAEVAAGNVVPVDGLSILAWGPRWLQAFRLGGRAYKTDRSRFYMHIATAEFNAKPMASIEPAEIVAWAATLKEKNTAHKYGKRPKKRLSYRTRKRCLGLLRRLFADALESGLIKTNPALGIRLKKTENDVAEDQVPEEWPLKPAEQAVLRSAVGHDPEWWIIQFAVGTALRQGEQWNLHLADVHIDGDRPHVYVRFGSRGRLPKNKKTRKVPLFGIGLEAVREWLKILPTYAPHNPLGLMFPTPHREPAVDGKRRALGGARRQPAKVPKAWTRAKAVLGRPVWWHLLRHTTATALLCGWWGKKWTLAEVGKLLGHSSVRTTEIYAHLLDSAVADLAAETDQAWSKQNGHPRNGRSGNDSVSIFAVTPLRN
jgi:integrase